MEIRKIINRAYRYAINEIQGVPDAWRKEGGGYTDDAHQYMYGAMYQRGRKNGHDMPSSKTFRDNVNRFNKSSDFFKIVRKDFRKDYSEDYWGIVWGGNETNFVDLAKVIPSGFIDTMMRNGIGRNKTAMRYLFNAIEEYEKMSKNMTSGYNRSSDLTRRYAIERMKKIGGSSQI